MRDELRTRQFPEKVAARDPSVRRTGAPRDTLLEERVARTIDETQPKATQLEAMRFGSIVGDPRKTAFRGANEVDPG